MLTIAQMFLLNTCTALPCFSRMWSSAASTNVVFSTGLPPATCVPHQGGDAPGWEDTPLRGCEVAPHLLLDPGEVTWEETESPSWEQPRPTSRWMLKCNTWRWWPPRSWGSQHGPVLTERFQMKVSLDWISWERTNCQSCSSGATYEPRFCAACSKTAPGTIGSVDTTSHWAARTLLHLREKQDSPEVLTKLWGLEPDDLQSPLPTQAILCFYVSFLWGVLYKLFYNNN